MTITNHHISGTGARNDPCWVFMLKDIRTYDMELNKISFVKQFTIKLLRSGENLIFF